MTRVVFGLGSNIGRATRAIQEAVNRLSDLVDVERVSSFYSSTPMYVLDQDPFVNAVAIGRTNMGPWPLLSKLKEIEKRMGRVERSRNGPREIDIDIIAYGALRYRFRFGREVQLEIPHPRLSERRFVLLPLCEIEPTFLIPGLAPPLELLSLTESQSQDVTRLEDEILSIHRT